MFEKQKKILIVDDEADFATFLKARLENAKYRVSVAHNPWETREKVKSFSPDVVLMDLQMPEVPGDLLAMEIRRKRPIPVIALTGHGDPTTVATTCAMGFADHIVKPCDPTYLIQRIEKCLTGLSASSRSDIL
jgi:DNA-binding response OmpR family regulator